MLARFKFSTRLIEFCSMKAIIFYFLCFVVLSPIASAEVYKCVDAKGQIKYQSEKCADKDHSKIMIIKDTSSSHTEAKPKLKLVSEQDPLVRQQKLLERKHQQFLKTEKKQNCAILIKRFKAAEKKVKDKCKKNRNTFCNLSAIQIEQNERNLAIHQISNSQRGGVVSIPKYSEVEILDKEYEDFGCR